MYWMKRTDGPATSALRFENLEGLASTQERADDVGVQNGSKLVAFKLIDRYASS